ncbi:ATP-binding protein [Dehalobacter sp. DCM]|uniref:ATP-binding protein n=1 Tax=Dehalobacter sp. DCM TaxID=2907827 RepID=UPI0030817BFC|nr:ATP-binding protein [Dehalobacter sp. DCM]
MTKNNFPTENPLLKGAVVDQAKYITQIVQDYEGNPFIESLPPIFSEDEVAENLLFYPLITEDELDYSKNVRFHLIRRLRSFIQPLPVHFDIEKSISVLIRRGYLARNPITKEFLKRLQILNTVKESKKNIIDEEVSKEFDSYLRSTADSISIIGISGIGKTTAVEKILLMYPQVIYHQEYRGVPLTRTQIVWLKIDSPYDGSLKTLCKNFFKAVDGVLESTDYFSKYNSETTSTMMIHMAYLSSLHGIGLLVIDEIQFLIKPKSESEDILNFLVTLTNIVGIPLVLIGTFKAMKLLDKELKSGRRVCSEAGILWDKMDKDVEWDLFLESMWYFQYLKEKIPLTPELNEVMYEQSQGITAIAVNLFILVQGRALFTEKELITPALIRKTAKKDLFIVQKIIKAIRTNDYEKLIRYEDVIIDYEVIINSIENAYKSHGAYSKLLKDKQELNKTSITNISNNIYEELKMFGIFKNLSDHELKTIVNTAIESTTDLTDISSLRTEVFENARNLNIKKDNTKDSKKGKNTLSKNDLRNIYNESIKQKKHVYDLLLEADYIKDPYIEFYEIS